MADRKQIPALRFALPVAIENMATTTIGLVFSAIIGGISPSALVAVGTTNQMVVLLTSMLSMLSTGAAVLVARYVGARDRARTSAAVEQAIGMTGAFSVLITIFVIALARPILHLMLPGAEEALFSEAVVYMRSVMLSFPFLMYYNVLSGVLRATGNSRTSMYVSIGMNVVQLLCAWLFLKVLRMDMMGAGLAYVVCRLVGAAAILTMVLRGSDAYSVHWPHILKPDRGMCRKILQVGVPTSFEALSVQVGYVVTNAMTVGLGTQAAAVAQVVNTLNSFPCVVHTICTAVTMPIVGQYIGARRKDMAMRSAWSIWAVCMSVSLLICLGMALLGERATRLYTQDAFVASESAWLLWSMLLYHVFGASINSVDPALKVG
ncbi:MAG: MATE family efflux transporter, partial [Eubacteriales bacterium]|nr:MATE family efflux transporter [Eubacteriales bacterium]